MLIQEELICLSGAFFISCLISFLSIPSIVFIAKAKNLCAGSNARSSHKGFIPNLGGVALFASIMLSVNFMNKGEYNLGFSFLMGGIIILFFMGLKDDILIIDPLKKIIGQILVSFLLAAFTDVRIDNLFGLFGVYQLNYHFSVLLTTFGIMVIINAYNLIDGIDGLVSGIGIICASSFTLFFIVNGIYLPALLGVALVGALGIFFYFNVFSHKNKLFMGDTGSMIVGLILAFLAIRFISSNANEGLYWHISASPAIAFGIMGIPLTDVLRVMFIRVIRKRSPFSADKLHLHHILLRAGFTHRQATLRLMLQNVIFIMVSYVFRNLNQVFILLIIFMLSALYTSWACFLASDKSTLVKIKLKGFFKYM